jgi:hypothetical protein
VLLPCCLAKCLKHNDYSLFGHPLLWFCTTNVCFIQCYRLTVDVPDNAEQLQISLEDLPFCAVFWMQMDYKAMRGAWEMRNICRILVVNPKCRSLLTKPKWEDNTIKSRRNRAWGRGLDTSTRGKKPVALSSKHLQISFGFHGGGGGRL